MKIVILDYVGKIPGWNPQCGIFSVTQILREINFGELRSSKNAIFAILGALNFDFHNFSTF